MFKLYLQERQTVLGSLCELEGNIKRAAEQIVACLHAGNKLLICGNGGSAAEAQHFSTELVGRFKTNRRSLPAVSLNADGSLLTCIANDFGADFVFSRQLEGLAQTGDMLVVFSSSGNSRNIVLALEAARQMGISSLSFLGKGGGCCTGMADCELLIPADSTAVVQEMHLLLIHYLCEQIETAFPAQ
jgi:D-sedoheptulose 7-phosphate isomerase